MCRSPGGSPKEVWVGGRDGGQASPSWDSGREGYSPRSLGAPHHLGILSAQWGQPRPAERGHSRWAPSDPPWPLAPHPTLAGCSILPLPGGHRLPSRPGSWPPRTAQTPDLSRNRKGTGVALCGDASWSPVVHPGNSRNCLRRGNTKLGGVPGAPTAGGGGAHCRGMGVPTAGGWGCPLQRDGDRPGLVAGCTTGERDPSSVSQLPFPAIWENTFPRTFCMDPGVRADLLLGLESGGACGAPDRVWRVGLSSETEDLGARKLHVQITKCHLGWEPQVQGDYPQLVIGWGDTGPPPQEAAVPSSVQGSCGLRGSSLCPTLLAASFYCSDQLL